MSHIKPAFLKFFFIFISIGFLTSCAENGENKDTGDSNPKSETSQVPITLLPTKFGNDKIPNEKAEAIIHEHFNPDDHRHIKIHAIHDDEGDPKHLIVYLLHKDQHRVAVSNVAVSSELEVQSVVHNYKPTESDYAQHHEAHTATGVCPDESIQFIAFCPNQNELELSITNEVADTAEAHGLVTKRLLVADATRTNYLNYMACPNLIGNFYDGDANPYLITTNDGSISASDMSNVRFRGKVTNYWLACEAYNDPMKSAVLTSASTQKYAAGINDLIVGPSDRTAACAMISAIQGDQLSSSFESCKTTNDNTADQWGYGGSGSDYFGQ